MFHVEHIYKTLKHKRNKKRPLYSGLLTIYIRILQNNRTPIIFILSSSVLNILQSGI